ncbi:MAG TPA: PrsW family intramembrane metalloprotease [Thermoanaerobaculia bacterium]|jgi:RsiW-degrading membrane proteinase PrsW (M82 family)|nr:PrsW family intramembrane metalloprotease [Thermoanaerobaculia bacterium]
MDVLSLALALSFVPAFLCAAFIYWIDRYEKEPKLLLGGVFWWGAVVAAGGALVSQLFLEGTVELATGSAETAQLAGATLFAPLTEESLKGMAVLVVFLIFRREFDSVLDGLVYAGVAALGFAATENVLYYIDANTKHGVEGMLGLWFVRGVLGAWDHPFYTAWIGLGLAVTRLSLSGAIRWLAPPAGWGLAVGAHSLHNVLATAAPRIHELGVVMFLLDWTGWFVIAVVLLGAVWRERQMLRLQLADEVMRGTLDERQYRTALSAGFHLGARVRALGSGRLLATRRFYRLCGELAHKKQQLARLGDEDGASLLVEKLREEMRQLAPLAAA